VKRIAVIGLGQFGFRVAVALAEMGAEVMAIDNDPRRIEQKKDRVDRAVTLDATDEEALVAHKIAEVDTVVIGIGEHSIEKSILATALVKKLNVGRVVARASSPLHAQILEMVGAQKVVNPEEQMALMVARSVLAPDVLEYIPFATGFALMELRVPPEFVGRSLADLALRQRFGVNVIAIKREHPIVDVHGRATVKVTTEMPRPTDEILAGDILVTVGPEKGLQALERE